MQDFRKLQVWRKSHQFVLAVHAVSAGYPTPDVETFRLCRKESAKGTLASPFSGLPGFLHSCPVSIGSDE
jgi:hypothetical protein